jgi:hypothetical protein
MDFCQNPDGSTFVSSTLASGGQEPSVTGWGALKLNLSIVDVMNTVQEGRMAGTGIWDIDGNKALFMNN